MLLRVGFIIVCLIALAGCATPPVAQLSVNHLWQDKAFNYRPAQVTETKETLFELDPAIAAKLLAPAVQNMSTERRVDYLISLLFPSGRIIFSYSAGHSTGAAETWRSKRGDCLSLTLLTYAAAKTLGISAQMQEVRVPVAIDRRDNVDFLSGHVNVKLPNAAALNVGGRYFPPGGIIVDFEPQVGSRQRGTSLSDDEILARFYNNRAAEYLAQRTDDLAYAYFKAAIITDAKLAAGYTNLAQLYYRHGLVESAEQVLYHAIALKDVTGSPLRALHNLLVNQGRDAEVRKYAELLRQHEDEDPYFWLGVGLDHLQQSRYAKAIDALERAEGLTSGFAEIHRYLAIAYWRNGQQSAADRQLSLLTEMNRDDPELEALSQTIRRDPRERAVQ